MTTEGANGAIGALGDIHGAFEAVREIMERHPEVPFWLCVGDVADADGNYEPLPAPLYWIKGNNENFDLIEQGMAGHKAPPYTVTPQCGAGLYAPPYNYIPNAELIEIEGIRVAGLGGTFAPTMYELAAADLPTGTGRGVTRSRKAPAAAASSESASGAAAARGGGAPRAGEAPAAAASSESSSGAAAARGGGAPRALRNDKRRHFVHEEVERCKAMSNIDIFLSHEAPRPFRSARGNDAGKAQINEILVAMKPRLHLFGHHHRFADAEVGGIRSLCLDLVGNSYLLIDRKTLEYQHLAVK